MPMVIQLFVKSLLPLTNIVLEKDFGMDSAEQTLNTLPDHLDLDLESS